ncbi:MAG: sensor domain-containing diguanylate cyclase [Deltaproteobacteria bacterium]|nr:sensor domain-containing diguanylate cyclase [Deltaproteobacteria bacterium]
MNAVVPFDANNKEQLLPKLTHYLDYFRALSEVAKALTKSLKLDDATSTIGEAITQLLKPRDWSLLLIDEPTQELYFAVAMGEAADKIKNLRLKIGEGIAGWVAEHRESLLVPKVADDPRFCPKADQLTSFHTSSILCVPLICRDRVLGVIELIKGGDDPEPYQEEHLELLTPIADFAAIAIDNAITFERLQDMTIIDEWTGLYNARFLHRFIEEESRRAKRYRHDLSIVFIDLDHFKQVNDTHGHSVGSTLLCYIGDVIKTCIRDTDRAIRYGGDEFVIVMPETPKQGAIIVAERLRQNLADNEFVVGKAIIKITASMGVAAYPDDGSDGHAVLGIADQSMYRAKNCGRNSVIGANL